MFEKIFAKRRNNPTPSLELLESVNPAQAFRSIIRPAAECRIPTQPDQEEMDHIFRHISSFDTSEQPHRVRDHLVASFLDACRNATRENAPHNSYDTMSGYYETHPFPHEQMTIYDLAIQHILETKHPEQARETILALIRNDQAHDTLQPQKQLFDQATERLSVQQRNYLATCFTKAYAID